MLERNLSDEALKRTKRRRHGYRGFGSPLHRDRSGSIHWGRGFSGVGFPGEDGGALPRVAQDLRILSLREESSKL